MVLDVGCGSGLFFRYVDLPEIVVGADISRMLLLQAKKKTRKANNVHLLLADADFLPFKNTLFSEVFAFTVLQNMPKPTETLNELKRVTVQNGRFVVTGLKKAFTQLEFIDMLKNSSLSIVQFFDEEFLKCYIAVCIRN